MKRYLIIRLSSIGDIVLTTPVVRCLKAHCDAGDEVHFLTKPQFAGIVESNPYVDKVLTLKPRLMDTIREIRAGGYDYIIDLHHNLRSFAIKRLTGAKSYSFNKINVRKWLLVHLKINVMPDVHIVDRYFGAVARLGVVNDHLGLDFFVPKELDDYPKTILPEQFKQGYVCAVIGATHPTKQIPPDKMVQILNAAQMPVCLIGGKDVLESAATIEQGLTVPCYNGVGQFSLNQSAAIVRDAEVVLTPDTGMMHIAAAFGKRIVSLWGNTVPELGMYPYLADADSKIFETKGLRCRPCSKIGYKKCPKGHFKCMNNISAPDVAAAIRKTAANNQ